MSDNQGKPGRPRVWRPYQNDLTTIEQQAALGKSENDCAEFLGVTRKQWRVAKAKYPGVELAYNEGKAQRGEHLKQRMQDMADDPTNKNHLQALKWVLENEFGFGTTAKKIEVLKDSLANSEKLPVGTTPFNGYAMVPMAPRTDKPADADEGKDAGTR